MNVIQAYNNLNGKEISRKQLEEISKEAVKQGYSIISNKLEFVLNNNSEKWFDIVVNNPITETGLNATALNKDTINFNKQILKAKRNGYSNIQSFNLGLTKNILLENIGLKKVFLSGSVIKKSISKDKNHCLKIENYINLPDYINNPLAIFKSATKENAIVVILELKNELNKPLLVALHLNEFVKISDVRSVYSKNNISIYKKWYNDNLLIYANKKSEFYKLIVAPIATKLVKNAIIKNKDNKNNIKKANITKKGLKGIDENDIRFFPKYTQFKNKPKEAIKHLLKEKKGDCLNALYRKDVGFIDIVWGENNEKNKGFGLKHIYEKHGKEIEQLGFKIEDFLPIIIQFGDFVETKENTKIILQGQMFRVVLSKIAYNQTGIKENKTFVLSAFDLRPMWKKEKSRGLNGTYDGISFTKKPLLSKTLDLKNKDNKNNTKKTNVTNKDLKGTENIPKPKGIKPYFGKFNKKPIVATEKNKNSLKPSVSNILNGKKNTKNLDNNPRGFDLSKKLGSNLELQAITDISIFNKEKELFNVYHFLYTQFYIKNNRKIVENQEIIFENIKDIEHFKIKTKNKYYSFYKYYDAYEFTITDNGVQLIKQIKERLTSLENQKSNYSFFKGLKGVELSSEYFKEMSVSELRTFMLDFYNKNLKGKKTAIKKHLKEVVFVANAGRKILKPIYSEKVAVLEKLEEIIKNSTYNNFGSRKETDTKDVLGYLNFKSKVLINGEKRHVRISVVLDNKRKTNFKSFEVGKIKKSDNFREVQTMGVPKDGEIKSLSEYKDNKNNTKKANITKKGLTGLENIPNPNRINLKNAQSKTQPNNKVDKSTIENKKVDTEVRPKQGLNNVAKRTSLAHKMANRNTNFEYFNIANKDISAFLGQIEKKEKESIVISLTGGQGSMKTRFAFQFMNALAQNYNCGHASIEEHPESKLYFDKAEQYLNEKALNNIEAPEVKNINDLHQLIKNNDVIIIDSYAKMQEIEKGFEVDKDLRKKYNGKLFLVIFQQTTDGKMRGGSKSQFDADIVLFTEKKDDYINNYIYADKNRYQSKSLDTLHFNIFNGKLNHNNNDVIVGQTQTIQQVIKDNKLHFVVK